MGSDPVRVNYRREYRYLAQRDTPDSRRGRRRSRRRRLRSA